MSALIAAVLAFQTPAARPNLDWLEGHWRLCGRGWEIAETWRRERGGWLSGVKSFDRDPDAQDRMRIGPARDGRPGGVSLYRHEGGGAGQEYPLVDARGTMAIFFNPRLYPKRIIYRREGRRLVARTEINVPDDPLNGTELIYRMARPDRRCARPDTAPG